MIGRYTCEQSMDSTSSPSSILLLACFLTVVLALVLNRRLFDSLKRSQSLPPGPKGLPWLGPLAQIPRREEWKTFHKWCSECSMCRHLALVSNWTAAASLLATLQFSKHPDDPDVGPNFESGLSVSVYIAYCQRI
jgi:hypothetical protein